MHNARWSELVQLLHADLELLVAEFMAGVGRIPPYSREHVPLERVRSDAMLSFDHLIRRLAGVPAPPAVDAVAATIGRDRARRQIPLEHLLRAVRQDFQVIWSALQAHARADDLPVLVEHVEEIWSVVEDYTTQVQVSYLAESALMARERSRERSALVARLLDAPDLDPADVEQVAIALGIDAADTLLVACAPTNRQAPLYRAYENLLAEDRRVHWQERGTHALLILQWHGADDRAVQSVIGKVACGIGPLAIGLPAVRRSARIALRVAETLDDQTQSPQRVNDVWLRLVATSLGDLRPDLETTVLGGLARLTEGERERLMSSVRCFLGSGSVQETASLLYCHRNTVLNRLHRFAAVTGYDVMVPKQAATVLVAMEGASSRP
jgi:hypothetical protein